MSTSFLLASVGKHTGLWRTGAAAVLCTVLLQSMFGFPGLSVAASDLQDSSRHLYDRVMMEVKHGDYEAALAGFRLFLELHSKSALAGNAQYWIGECQYRLGRYKDALNSFVRVASYHPVSPKMAASAFKIGQTYAMLGDFETARLMFDKVLDHYPGGAEAELASRAIQSMNLKIDPKPRPPVKNVNSISP
jgi:tol-pal system protein YbgF